MVYALSVPADSSNQQPQKQHASSAQSNSCNRWRSLVDPKAPHESPRPDFDKLSDEEAFIGIDCLLAMQGIRRHGAFGGATRLDVSQLYPEATVELDALYVVSAIYNQKWQHAQGIALMDKNGAILRPHAAAKRAFPFARKWYLRARKMGLPKMRELNDDPLKGSGVRWP
jgi:hypothetical protein